MAGIGRRNAGLWTFLLVVSCLSAVLTAGTAQGQSPAQQPPAQPPAQTAAPQPQPQPPPALPQIMPQPVTTAASQQQACAQTITTTALSPDTIVSIKDHGDSQTVLVYKIDDQGNVRLAGRTKTKY